MPFGNLGAPNHQRHGLRGIRPLCVGGDFKQVHVHFSEFVEMSAQLPSSADAGFWTFSYSSRRDHILQPRVASRRATLGNPTTHERLTLKGFDRQPLWCMLEPMAQSLRHMGRGAIQAYSSGLDGITEVIAVGVVDIKRVEVAKCVKMENASKPETDVTRFTLHLERVDNEDRGLLTRTSDEVAP
jgi:hypothetical protein